MKTLLALCLLVTSAHAGTVAAGKMKHFISLEQMLQVLPASLQLPKAYKFGNDILRERAVGRWAAVTVPVTGFEPHEGAMHRLKGRSPAKEVMLIKSTRVRLDATIYVDDASVDAATAIKFSKSTEVFGLITRAEFGENGDSFILEMQHCRVGVDATKAAGAAVTVVSAPVPLVGNWEWQDGTWTSPITIHADGTCDRGGAKGTWSVAGRIAIIKIGDDELESHGGIWAPETRFAYRERMVTLKRAP